MVGHLVALRVDCWVEQRAGMRVDLLVLPMVARSVASLAVMMVVHLGSY